MKDFKGVEENPNIVEWYIQAKNQTAAPKTSTNICQIQQYSLITKNRFKKLYLGGAFEHNFLPEGGWWEFEWINLWKLKYPSATQGIIEASY